MKATIEECVITTDSVVIKTRVVGDIHSGTGMLPEEKYIIEKYIVVNNKLHLDNVFEESVF